MDKPIVVNESGMRVYGQLRNIGKRYNQLLQIKHLMMFEPKKRISVLSLRKGYRGEFLNFAKQHGIVFEATEETPFGEGAWQFALDAIRLEGNLQ